MVVNYNGALADSAWTYTVGKVSKETEHLVHVTRESLYKAIEVCVEGNRIGDIGHAIQTYVEAEGFSVVRDFIGHGIGNVIHEEPQVPHYGLPNKGPRLKEGMVFTIEPMVNVGTYKASRNPNGWTASTADERKYSAQYEHTIAITKNGPPFLPMNERMIKNSIELYDAVFSFLINWVISMNTNLLRYLPNLSSMTFFASLIPSL